MLSSDRLEYYNINDHDVPISTSHMTDILFYHTDLSLAKPNKKGVLKWHLSARICFSVLPEDRRATVCQRANWFSSRLSAVNEHQQYKACDIFHLLERWECYFVTLSMKELWFSDQPESLFLFLATFSYSHNGRRTRSWLRHFLVN